MKNPQNIQSFANFNYLDSSQEILLSFKIHYIAKIGEIIAVTGNIDPLGFWNYKNSLPLT